MKALVYSAPGEYAIEELPIPVPTGSQVLLRVHACGVCKTDLHIHQGQFFSAFPLIPGHEFAGEVAAVGPAVVATGVGMRVVADNERQCGSCYHCRRNEPLFCERLVAQGVNAPGGFAEYVLVEEQQVYPLADEISFLEGAMVEPAACAVHGLDVIRPRVGDEIVQFGAGPTGLILAQLLRSCGAGRLVMADLSIDKLTLARRLTGAEIILVDPTDPTAYEKELQERAPRGFDIAIDATGVPAVVERLPQYVRNGGKVVIYGVCPEDATIRISPYEVFRRQLTILGSFSQALTFERATRLVNEGVIMLKEMITHTLTLEEWGRALELVRSGATSIKVIIVP
jgi:D-arabinitol dehydrogenase (NADP+)